MGHVYSCLTRMTLARCLPRPRDATIQGAVRYGCPSDAVYMPRWGQLGKHKAGYNENYQTSRKPQTDNRECRSN